MLQNTWRDTISHESLAGLIFTNATQAVKYCSFNIKLKTPTRFYSSSREYMIVLVPQTYPLPRRPLIRFSKFFDNACEVTYSAF